MFQLRCILRFALAAGIAGALLSGLTLLTTMRMPRAAAQAPAVVIVTNTNDSGPGSLRQAILDVEPGGTILFDPGLAGGRIILTSGQLVISQSLTIDASAAVSLTVDGNRSSRVFLVAEDTIVELIALRITGGQAPVNDEESIGHGGGILNLGELTLTGCTVVDNRAGAGRTAHPQEPPSDPCPFVRATPGGDGGAIFNQGRLILRATTLISNTAGGGGGGLGMGCDPEPGARGGNGGGVFSGGILEVIESAVQANRAGDGGSGFGPYAAPGNGGHGGGLYSAGFVTVTHTLLAGNVAGQGEYPYWWSYQYYAGSSGGDGGGIYLAAPGRLTLIDSTLQSNTAGSGETTAEQQGGAGGGLYTDGVAWIAGSVFASNRAGASQGIGGHASGGNGGAIANHGTLVLRDSVLDANSSGAGSLGGSGGAGGGLWNRGAARLTDSAITNNVTSQGSNGLVGGWRGDGTPGGHGGDGAGVWNDGSLNLLRVTVDGNKAGGGGLGGWNAIYPYSYGLAGGNGGSGGGLWNSGQIMISQSTISRNMAGGGRKGGDGEAQGGHGGRGGDGGGLFNQGIAALFNSTVSGNAAGPGTAGGSATQTDPQLCIILPCRAGDGGNGGSGGGIYNSYSLTLNNCTLAINRADVAGQAGQGLVSGAAGVDGAGGGVYGVFAARDTILAGNSAPNVGPDCAGRLYTGSHNLLQNPAGCVIDPTLTNNVIGSSAALLSLAISAPGSTATHALVSGSPAMDAGSCSAGSVTHDQRGVPRPQGAGCDIGAYEFDGPTGWLLWLPHALRGGTP